MVMALKLLIMMVNLMAKYRQVHTTFWDDSFVLDLTPEEKYFYLYLMTNSKTTQCGIYELPKRIIEMQTGYNRETVDKLLLRFIEYGKVLYNDPTKEIFMTNWAKYNWIKSPKVISCIEKELKSVKYQAFVKEYSNRLNEYGYGIDTVSIDLGEEEEKEKEEEEEKNNKHIGEIVSYLNEKASTKYRSSSAKTKTLIKARMNEGFTVDDFKTAIDNKCISWLNTDMDKFLRPETLFGTKFESYLNEKPKRTGVARVGKNEDAEKFRKDNNIPF
jgi:uncharacterized phage protein (TIGR02220 family)